jgi:hypothetical protein
MGAKMDWMLSDLIEPALSMWLNKAGWLAAAGGLAVAAVLFSGRALASGSGNGLVAISRTLSSISAQQLMDIMERMCLDAERADSGDEEAIIWNMWGYKSKINFGDNGTIITFIFSVKGKKVIAEDHDRWNRNNRNSRSFTDGKGDPVLALDLDLVGGVCEARIIDFIGTCPTAVGNWIREILLNT